MTIQKIIVHNGIGQSFRRELSYLGVRDGITITRVGSNDAVEFDDEFITDPNDQAAILQAINNHDAVTVAAYSGDDQQEALFLASEGRRLYVMSPANLALEDLNDLLRTILELGPEGLADWLSG